jgi:plastocyanin
MRIKKTIIVAVLAAILGAAAALSRQSEAAPQEKAPGAAKVTMTNNKFEPKTVTVKAGSEVVWESKEGTHAVTADDGSWSSSAITAGKTFSHKFDKPGKYPYYCTFHGSKGGHEMAGEVIVK